MPQSARGILSRLESLGDPEAAAGMARYGIIPGKAYGISIPTLRKIAGEIGVDNALAEELWTSGVHEARILACYVDDPKQVSEEQMKRWVASDALWELTSEKVEKSCAGNRFQPIPQDPRFLEEIGDLVDPTATVCLTEKHQ